MKRLIVVSFLLGITLLLTAQSEFMDEIPLYDKVPNAKPLRERERSDTDKNGVVRITLVSNPTLQVFLPPKEKANGTALIICPGGGYRHLAMGYEGINVAKRFAAIGVTTFVLKYRLPDDSSMVNKEIGPIQDAQQAIYLVRSKSKDWGIDPKKVGIMGFSAGGHLASSAGTHFKHHFIAVPKRVNLRPDFMLLGYPVISLTDSLAHWGSRKNLLGDHPTAAKVQEWSNEWQVKKNTPPTFIVHARDDKTVKVQNSELFYEALLEKKVPAKLYLYEKGGHGFGMYNKSSDVDWINIAMEWMKEQHFLPAQ